jgi:rSAM/selenodomain-associated transferase 2
VLSLIIPTLNCRENLERTLQAVELRPAEWEVVVADGGSHDGTAEAAELAGARVVNSPKGRGVQLQTGAAHATRSWYLFLHADTLPQPGWAMIVEQFITTPEHWYQAAYFQLIFDDVGEQARRVESMANWRARTLGLPYGDQGLLISAEYYDHLGGFKPIPVMEDVDMVRRIGARRLHMLDSAAVTSAARYRRDGWWARPIKNVSLLGLYLLGVSPTTLQRWYQ